MTEAQRELMEKKAVKWARPYYIVSEYGVIAEKSFFAGFTEGLAAQAERVKELEGAFDLREEEYVQAVGTWKIIQRLEEERDALAERCRVLEEALEWISGYSKRAEGNLQLLDAALHMELDAKKALRKEAPDA